MSDKIKDIQEKEQEAPATGNANPSDKAPTKEEPSLKEVIQEQAREDEETLTSSITLRKILGGDFLTASMLRRQIGIILIIVAFVIVAIHTRYCRQQNLPEIDKLNT